MSVGIYKITNKINEKCYIGQSVNIENRWIDHRKSINTIKTYDYPLYRAIRKYGLENFSFEIIKECKENELNSLEIYYVEKYNSFENGYNQTLGGDKGKGYSENFSEKDIEDITKLLLENDISQLEIASIYNVTKERISDINTGKTFVRDIKYPIRRRGNYCPNCDVRIDSNAEFCRKCYLENIRNERPSGKELLNLAYEKGFSGAAIHYGVSDNTIKRWLKDNGLPYMSKDVKEHFNKNLPAKEKRRDLSQVLIKVYYKGNEYSFNGKEEMISFIREQDISKSSDRALSTGISRLLNGSRQSYLQFTLVE